MAIVCSPIARSSNPRIATHGRRVGHVATSSAVVWTWDVRNTAWGPGKHLSGAIRAHSKLNHMQYRAGRLTNDRPGAFIYHW
jgi:hypothetical protein